MSAPASKPVGLSQLADDLLAFARHEAREGYGNGRPIQVRDAAEKAWNAAIQATDLAMRFRGQMPTPGPQAHQDRSLFLASIGRRDLQKNFTFFADRLHGGCFYEGRLPHEEEMNTWLDEVAQYIADVKAGI